MIPDEIRQCLERPCWIWPYVNLITGYGQMVNPTRSAHRAAYKVLVGEIPPGMQLDHLCRVRTCVNPSHLEPVTGAENLRRGMGGAVTKSRHAAVTHCPRGHELVDMIWTLGGDGLMKFHNLLGDVNAGLWRAAARP